MTIAVDADGTLFANGHYPELGPVNMSMVSMLKKLQAVGHKLILWTCREDESLQKVIDEMALQGIVFDAVNENVENFEHARRKIVADVYVDDRAMTPGDFMMGGWKCLTC